MWFWILMYICNLLVPAVMIIAGYMMYKHPPKRINGTYGYRTARSMKNMDTWIFAHNYCGKLWLKAGIIMLFPTLISLVPFLHSSDDAIGIATLLVEGVQIAVLTGTVFRVEEALKKQFDDGGNRR